MQEGQISVKKAAELIKVTPHYIRKLLREKKLDGKQNEETGRWTVDMASLEKFKQTDFYLQNVDSLRKPQTLTIKEAVEDVEEHFETDIISYISFPGSPVSFIDQNDCILLDDLLYNIQNPYTKGPGDKKFKRLTLFLHSGGGILEAAIKFVDIIRQYANEYFVIVPIMAKSAATAMVLKADRIYLTTLSELGPVDPMVQSPTNPNLIVPATAIYNFLEYYRQKNTNTSNTNTKPADIDPIMLKKLEESIDPFLLGAHMTSLKFSTKTIEEALKAHAMKNADPAKVQEAVKEFTTEHDSHAFPITYTKLQTLGIGEKIINSEQLGYVKTLMAIYQQFMVNSNVIKLIGNREENKNITFTPLNPMQQVPTKTSL